MSQLDLFALLSPRAPTPSQPARMGEREYYQRIYGQEPTEVLLCSQGKGEYLAISWHYLYACPKEPRPYEQTTGLPQVRTQSETNETDMPKVLESPGEAPIGAGPLHLSQEASPGDSIDRGVLGSGESGRPGEVAAPASEPVAPTLDTGEARAETPALPRLPHWWHWVKSRPPLKVTIQLKKKTKEIFIQPRGQYPYTPPLAVRRRSIPAIACSLYYTAWGCFGAKDEFDNSAPGCVRINKTFLDIDTAKVERLIALLVYCEVPEESARELARDAWYDAKEGIYRRWSDRGEHLGIGRFKIEQLGYELGDQEDDGYGDTEAAAFVEFAVKEGVKGR